MSDIGADVLAEWRVVPEDVASLPVFAFGSRGGFVVEGVLTNSYLHADTETKRLLFRISLLQLETSSDLMENSDHQPIK